MLNKLLTTEEVAEYLHCSTHHISNMRRAGLISGTKISHRWLYPEAGIVDLIANTEGKDLTVFKKLSAQGVKKLLEK